MVEDGIPFAKMSGSGNDFVVIDNRDAVVHATDVPVFVRAVCRRGLGMGADGVVLIGPAADPAQADFAWRYVNADGSDGEMCGNGAMCGARFAVGQGIAPADCRFETESGLVTAHVGIGPVVELEMVPPGPVQSLSRLSGCGYQGPMHTVTVGVPHVVLMVDDVDDFPLEGGFVPFARAIRRNPLFAAGTNVNVIHRIDAATIRMRTYERGVEDETLACGTGAVASAIVAVRLGLVQPVTVMTSSGRPLRPTFVDDGAAVRDVLLGGEARFVARGTLDAEGLR